MKSVKMIFAKQWPVMRDYNKYNVSLYTYMYKIYRSKAELMSLLPIVNHKTKNYVIL